MDKSMKKHCCPHTGCNSKFNRPYRLAQHIKVHVNIDSLGNSVFQNIIAAHVKFDKEKLSIEKSFNCSVDGCNKSYTNKSHLDRHFRTIHETKKDNNILFTCPKCMKRFSNRQNLIRHIKLHSSKEFKVFFKCDICSHEFRKKHLLTAHMFKHTGVKSFSCEKCSEIFVSLKDKKRHARKHKTYFCDVCQMKFDLWSLYQKHVITEHKVNEFVCDDCGRSFKQRSHIVRHVKVHYICEEIKKNSCPYKGCNRSYTRNSNLRQHILYRHKNLVFECNICKAGLSTKAKLDQHLKLHDRPKEQKHTTKSVSSRRKERKDKGMLKVSTALKLAGLIVNPEKIITTLPISLDITAN